MAAPTPSTITQPNPVIVDLTPMVFPRTILLRSGASNRAIKLSVDGGIEFFQPNYDANSQTLLALVVNGPATTAQITGATGDTWDVI